MVFFPSGHAEPYVYDRHPFNPLPQQQLFMEDHLHTVIPVLLETKLYGTLEDLRGIAMYIRDTGLDI